jgi:uncharacterized transporter YbjL
MQALLLGRVNIGSTPLGSTIGLLLVGLQARPSFFSASWMYGPRYVALSLLVARKYDLRVAEATHAVRRIPVDVCEGEVI